MDEMLSYIFGGIQRNDTSIRSIKRGMKQQNKFNLRVVMLIGGMLYTIHRNDRKQNIKIKTLAKEIDEMKRIEKEGE